MSDIPNPFAPFDVFFKNAIKVERKPALRPLKKLFSKKLAKRLFGKPFAKYARSEIQSQPELARPIIKSKRPSLVLGWAKSADEVKEAQRLRFKVFAEEMGANLP
ncbi:MAG: hemolysin, partial [Polynucleobacter sp.]|nr:hemolysin [Polynucleobacter sp.]